MSKQRIVPCLWLDDQAEQAAAFYTRIFPAGRITAVSRYPESADNPGGKPRGSVMTIELEIAGLRMTALNGGPQFRIGPSISVFAHAASPAEADRWFAALADGGTVRMPLAAYPWSERYGWVQDRYGVSWQVITGARPAGGQTLVPCLMFAGPQQGRAEEAIGLYTTIFPGGRIEQLDRYAAGEGPVGTIKHGRFVVDGQPLVAMDSHAPHDVTFTEALSLQVMCADQAEVDRYWAELSDGGEQGPCGWLKDRFGVSWQIVPAQIAAWLTCPDAAARDRAFAAVMTMRKLDIATIEAAFVAPGRDQPAVPGR
jgi:predicted 3-demethylubiquinone-9 3-methyltransferase (glyoxalase superfamily)